MKTCYGCKNCQSGTWTIDPHISVNDGTFICVMTGNVLVDDCDREINVTACSCYQEYQTIKVQEKVFEPVPF